MSEERIVKTICNMCQLGCGINVHVAGERAVRISPMEEHPLRILCPKADSQAILEMVYSEERLRTPLKKVNGTFKEISWDDAFDFISEELTRIKQQYAARAFAYNTGNAFISTQTEKVARRFCDLYGTPNFTSGASFCFYARLFAHNLTWDYRGGYALPSWRQSQCAIIWGSNPTESSIPILPAVNALRERGGKLIVIDPRVIPLAKQADIYAQVRPGTDCALALGLLNVVINEELYDREFTANWTIGFDRLVEHVKGYSPEKVAEITWVPPDTIRAMARMYAQTRPASIFEGVALDHYNNGFQASRAIAILIAITGNLDVPGGNAWPDRGKPFTNLRITDRIHDEDGIGAEYPIFNLFSRERSAMCIPDAILEAKPYPIKALLVHGSDPMRIWPNTSRAKKALDSLELLVVIDLFMTDTAQLADIVLPCASFLEGGSWKDYRTNGLPMVGIGKRAIEPIGSSREDWQIIAELGKKMGFGEYFPWYNVDELFQYLFEPTGITLEQFSEHPGGVFTARPRSRKYLEDGFNTPSGKVEIYSKTLEENGYAPLPIFEEPSESLVNRPDLAEEYPFLLITGAKTRYFTHSRFRNLPSLRQHVPEPLAEINAEAANRLGIEQGDTVVVESPRGNIRLKSFVTHDIHPNVVSIQHGWGEANANLLIDDAASARDPASSYPPFKAAICRVVKVN